MKTYRNVMFDLDGTVTDSGRAIISSVEYALAQMGIIDQPHEKLMTFIGPSLHDSFVREYGMTDEECDRAVACYRDVYEGGRMYEFDVYDGIPELLRGLKERDCLVILLTSKPQVFAEKIIDRIGLSEFFDHVVAPSLSDHSSDKSLLIERAVRDFGLDKRDCIMIGDTEYDIRGASDAGIDSIAVTYGYGSTEGMLAAGATCFADSAEDIAKRLLT